MAGYPLHFTKRLAPALGQMPERHAIWSGRGLYGIPSIADLTADPKADGWTAILIKLTIPEEGRPMTLTATHRDKLKSISERTHGARTGRSKARQLLEAAQTEGDTDAQAALRSRSRRRARRSRRLSSPSPCA